MTTSSVAPETRLPRLRYGRELTSDYASIETREWLVTNGIGGYAAGSFSGINTRGYHGSLVAALDPPVGRTLMLAGLVEEVTVGAETVPISALRWQDGTVAPDGRAVLQAVSLTGTTPRWHMATARFGLERTVTMDRGANVTRVTWTSVWSEGPMTLKVGVLADFRDYHSRSFASDLPPAITVEDSGFRVAGPDGHDLCVALEGARIALGGTYYRGFDLAQERARGLTDFEDHLHVGDLTVTLAPGASVQLVVSVGAPLPPDPMAVAKTERHERQLLERFDAAAPHHGRAPDWVRTLVLAADQFVVDRRLADGSTGKTVIAGYPWFADWGRDTMISLPGLTLTTGRPEVAADILRAFAEVVDGGLIPNRFPDGGTQPEYNTVDATFWFIDATRQHLEATSDLAFAVTLLPVLERIVDALQAGTRYGIGIDGDGLIRAGEEGVQLTWMDAKVGDWVVTPRRGKPVEVNALWISNLRFLVDLSGRAGRDPARYEALLARAVEGFERFWNLEADMPYDVIDGPEGHESAIRPNMIFAALARCGVFTPERRRRIVDVVAQRLLTPAGLRSLAPGAEGYRPSYGGDQTARDGAYHQGTVWAWLIGPFIEAHLDAYGDPSHAAALLAPMADQLGLGCLGTINEIFDADPPHSPCGCVAQAWTVAQTLRSWSILDARRTE
jgi:predicted glycogen debranching enzyme